MLQLPVTVADLVLEDLVLSRQVADPVVKPDVLPLEVEGLLSLHKDLSPIMRFLPLDVSKVKYHDDLFLSLVSGGTVNLQMKRGKYDELTKSNNYISYSELL